ncbi:MAG: HRDC domain-containing protein, partial [Synechococcaceae cyanobacterium]
VARLGVRLAPPSMVGGRGGGGATAWGVGVGGGCGGGAGAADLDAAALERLAALKAWRLQLAREQGVPPYVVFHDRTLIEIAARRPTALAELGGVSGVGAAKLERYGAAVLAVIAGAG